MSKIGNDGGKGVMLSVVEASRGGGIITSFQKYQKINSKFYYSKSIFPMF